LILASRSPQRSAILEQLGVPFEARAANVEEVVDGDPGEVAAENARRKALALAAEAGQAIVLGADTVVALEGRILPKPRDEAQAAEWLRALSGRTHEVLGGVCLARGAELLEALARTLVRFRALRDADVDWYLASGEWRERAGGYAVQGRGAALVETIEGDYPNVVGLSVTALLRLIPDLLDPSAR
jgi:septum formation protein